MKLKIPSSASKSRSSTKYWESLPRYFLSAEAMLCRLPAGRSPLWTARRSHWPRDAEYDKVGGFLFKDRDRVYATTLLTIDCSLHPLSANDDLFLRPPNNGRKSLHCNNVMLQVASLRHCDIMWQYMGIKFSSMCCPSCLLSRAMH